MTKQKIAIIIKKGGHAEMDKISYIKGARKKYPQWDSITVEKQNRFKEYHKKLIKSGFIIKAANIALKDGKLFWILEEDTDFFLEQYAVLQR